MYVRRATASGADRSTTLEAAALGVLGALAGSRLAAGLINGAGSLAHPIFGAEGAASWGAYAGGSVAASARLFFADRTNLLRHLDHAAPAVLAGIALARIGCFLNGDDFGTVCSYPWCVTFPAGSVAWDAHRALGWIDGAAPASLRVHPLQLYLSAAAAAACALVLLIERRHPMRPGGSALSGVLLYSTTRAPLELLREPAALPPGARVTGLQLAISLFVAAVVLWYCWRSTPERTS